MTNPEILTEQQKTNILCEHYLGINPDVLKEQIRSLRFTSDMKYIVFENEMYSVETGDLILLEKWSLSDILHGIGDVASMGMDFIVPGSGAIIDGVNAISYFIEALFTKDPDTKKKLYIMGAITAAFVIIPGALQAVAIPMKNFVKYGGKSISKAVGQGIGVIAKNIGKIMSALPNLVKKVAGSGLGKRLLGKNFSKKIVGHFDNIAKGIKDAFDDLGKKAKEAMSKEPPKDPAKRAEWMAKRAEKRSVKAGKKFDKRARRTGPVRKTLKSGARVLSRVGFKKLDTFFKLPKRGINGWHLRRLGFAPGHAYTYVNPLKNKVTRMKIVDMDATGVVMQRVGKTPGGKFKVSNEDFILNAVGAPWGRRGKSRRVPFFIKRLAYVILPEGDGIDEKMMAEVPPLDPAETSRESLAYLRDQIEKPVYQGHTKNYTVNPMVQAFQEGLQILGYSLGSSGIDGKFGPDTRNAVKKFQADNKLPDANGQMNRVTAKELATELEKRGGNENLQTILNNL